jgi:hypothetical protein
MLVQPPRETETFCTRVECAVRPMVAAHRVVEIIRSIGTNRLIGLLIFESASREIEVAQAWGDFLGEDRFGRRPGQPQLASAVLDRKDDGIGDELGLMLSCLVLSCPQMGATFAPDELVHGLAGEVAFELLLAS